MSFEVSGRAVGTGASIEIAAESFKLLFPGTFVAAFNCKSGMRRIFWHRYVPRVYMHCNLIRGDGVPNVSKSQKKGENRDRN